MPEQPLPITHVPTPTTTLTLHTHPSSSPLLVPSNVPLLSLPHSPIPSPVSIVVVCTSLPLAVSPQNTTTKEQPKSQPQPTNLPTTPTTPSTSAAHQPSPPPTVSDSEDDSITLSPATVPSAIAKTTYLTVLNLSSYLLTHDQHKALSFGLKFAPMPKEIPDPTEFFEKFEERCTRVYSHFTGASKTKLPAVMQAQLDLTKE